MRVMSFSKHLSWKGSALMASTHCWLPSPDNLNVVQSVRRNWRFCRCKVETVLWFIENWVPLHSFLMYIQLLRETIHFVFFTFLWTVMSSAVSLTFTFVLFLIQEHSSYKTTEKFARKIASVKRIPHLFFWSFLYNKLKFTLKSIDKILLSFWGLLAGRWAQVSELHVQSGFLVFQDMRGNYMHKKKMMTLSSETADGNSFICQRNHMSQSKCTTFKPVW